IALASFVALLALATWMLTAARRQTAEKTEKQIAVAAEPAAPASQAPLTPPPIQQPPESKTTPTVDEVVHAAEPADSAGWVLRFGPHLPPTAPPGGAPRRHAGPRWAPPDPQAGRQAGRFRATDRRALAPGETAERLGQRSQLSAHAARELPDEYGDLISG